MKQIAFTLFVRLFEPRTGHIVRRWASGHLREQIQAAQPGQMLACGERVDPVQVPVVRIGDPPGLAQCLVPDDNLDIRLGRLMESRALLEQLITELSRGESR